jgi:hypothetical protein
MRGVLIRLQENEKQTLGQLYIWDGLKLVFQGKTLELPWRDNERNVSRIPEGEYRVVRRTSKRFGQHFHIKDVPGRDLILIHVGNYYRQTEGCILIGQKFVDLDGDGNKDVSISRQTLEKLLKNTPKGFVLNII